MKKKTKTWLFTALAIGLIACGLSVFFMIQAAGTKIKLDTGYNPLVSTQTIQQKGHNAVIDDYVTERTVGYQNADGTKTLYVFSTPVRYRDANGLYSVIDDRLIDSDSGTKQQQEKEAQGYAYSVANNDIASYYPEKLNSKTGILVTHQQSFSFGINQEVSSAHYVADEKDMAGRERGMLCYKDAFQKGEDLYAFPSSLGVNCEIRFHAAKDSRTFTIWFDPSDGMRLAETPGGYLTLGNSKGETVGVIQKPLAVNSEGTVFYNGAVTFTEIGGRYQLSFTADPDAAGQVRMFLSFEMRREKSPDNAVYSKKEDLSNAFLSNFAVIGKSKAYGIGRLLTRNEFIRQFRISADKVLQANMYYFMLGAPDTQGSLEMVEMSEEWCSVTGNWNNHYQTGDVAATLKTDKQELCFDITQQIRKWCADATGKQEACGLQLKSSNEKGGQYILLTNDNSLYRNVTVITLAD